MSSATESTTLVCLFHHTSQANAARQELAKPGVDEALITTIAAGSGQSDAQLEALGVPERDLSHLREGIENGGTVIAVSALSEHVDAVERIFSKHDATKIDEAVVDDHRADALPLAGAAVAGDTAIPVVEEELQVGKRSVDRGGVRVYRRVVEIPAEENVNLREEHVVIERNPVDRPATAADLDGQGARSIELTETAEEAVISKNARVVEEVLVGKHTQEREQHIHDTVRRTEVEIEELQPADLRDGSRKTSL